MHRIINHGTDGEIGSIFNHCTVEATGQVPGYGQMTSDQIAQHFGLALYAGRVFALSRTQDVVQLHKDLRPHMPWVKRHYSQAGIDVARAIIWDDSFSHVNMYGQMELSVFYFGEKAHAVRPDDRWFNTTRLFNSKNHFINTCQSIGIPTPQTKLYNSKCELGDLNEMQYPLFFKLDVAVAGLGVMKCHCPKDLINALELIDVQQAFQIQEALAPSYVFKNVQFEVEAGELSFLALSDQLFDGFSHAGNRFYQQELSRDAQSAAQKLALYLYESGMKGVFAFDIAVDHRGDFRFIECNPRYNGATYPTKVARRLGIHQWTSVSLKTPFTSFDQVSFSKDVQYDPEKKRGALVINWGTISKGDVGILLAGSQSEQACLHQELKKTFHVNEQGENK